MWKMSSKLYKKCAMASWCGGAPHPRKRNPGGFRNLAHRRGDTIGSHFVAANRIASSKPPRFTRRWRRFGDFPPDPLETTQRRWLRPPSVGFCPPGDGGAAVGRGAQIVLNHPEFSPKPPNAGKHSCTEKGRAHSVEDDRTPSEFLTNNFRPAKWAKAHFATGKAPFSFDRERPFSFR